MLPVNIIQNYSIWNSYMIEENFEIRFLIIGTKIE